MKVFTLPIFAGLNIAATGRSFCLASRIRTPAVTSYPPAWDKL